MQKADIENKLELCIESFKSVLYERDETFLENMAKSNMDQGNLARYMLWEWTQGVGLYGLWKLFEKKHDQRCLDVLTEYYDARIAEGLPSKNINTMAPIFALNYLYEYTKNEKYGDICKEWAEWAMHGLPRAGEGGFQHVTSDRVNDGELWDDTLFMAVLPLANIGRILGRQDYIDEAVYQYLVHTKYLADKKTGLWYHGFCFDGCHNFAEAFWGRAAAPDREPGQVPGRGRYVAHPDRRPDLLPGGQRHQRLRLRHPESRRAGHCARKLPRQCHARLAACVGLHR